MIRDAAMAANPPQKSYWLKHDCQTGSFYAGAPGNPLIPEEVRDFFDEDILREPMIQYARHWLGSFSGMSEITTNFYAAITFDFKGYEACVYYEDSVVETKFFKTENPPEECPRIVTNMRRPLSS
jgi:hypothetical protein